jgi:hypothetical protein
MFLALEASGASTLGTTGLALILMASEKVTEPERRGMEF